MRLCTKCGASHSYKTSYYCQNCQRGYQNNWRKKNPEKDKRKRDKYYQTHRLKRIGYMTAYRKANPMVVRNMNHRRRGAKGSFTQQEWNSLVDYFGNRCAYCLEHFEKLTVDHIIPISKGGSNYIENIVPACIKCNMSKHDKSLLEILPC